MRDRFVELARTRLAAGAGHDDVLGDLRRHELSKIDSIVVLQNATGMPHAEAKYLVHHSQVWADHRDADDHVEDQFLRALFIACLVGQGQVNDADERAAEYRERQRRASTQMRSLTAHLPSAALTQYQRFMAENLLGRAFAALVDAGQRNGVPDQYWAGLATVADTLCLRELLGEGEPDADADDFVHAAHLVRTRLAKD